MYKRFIRSAKWVFVSLLVLTAPFGIRPAEAGPIILQLATNGSVDGAVESFDRDQLSAFETHNIITQTPWTEGETSFEGVLIRDLLGDLAGRDGTIVATALNDYSVEIPLDDFFSYDVILAYKRDGEFLTIRDRGPLWIIYPWNDFPGLRNELYYSRSIWQLKKIEVK